MYIHTVSRHYWCTDIAARVLVWVGEKGRGASSASRLKLNPVIGLLPCGLRSASLSFPTIYVA